jgi:hypothetical protein
LERLLPWLALVVAAAIAVVAVIELDSRSGEEPIAIPTFVQPSPTEPPSTAVGPTLSPTATAGASPTASTRRTAGAAAATETPEPSEAETPTAKPSPTRTPTPPRTPTPAPALTAGPLNRTKGSTPRTGGGAVANGLLIAGLALVLRAGVHAKGRSYSMSSERP